MPVVAIRRGTICKGIPYFVRIYERNGDREVSYELAAPEGGFSGFGAGCV